MRIAFDLDDTLIPSVRAFPTEWPPRRLLGWFFCRVPVRLRTTRLLRTLTNQGHDLWIYTTSLRGRFLIRQLVNISGVDIGGTINGDDHAKAVTNGCSKYPPAFGIDVLVDDSPGVALEGQRHGFRVIQISPDDDQWAERVCWPRLRDGEENCSPCLASLGQARPPVPACEHRLDCTHSVPNRNLAGANVMAKKKETEHHCCEKMCAMTCCPCHLDIKKLKPLVRNAKFICKACGAGCQRQEVSLRACCHRLSLAAAIGRFTFR